MPGPDFNTFAFTPFEASTEPQETWNEDETSSLLVADPENLSPDDTTGETASGFGGSGTFDLTGFGGGFVSNDWLVSSPNSLVEGERGNVLLAGADDGEKGIFGTVKEGLGTVWDEAVEAGEGAARGGAFVTGGGVRARELVEAHAGDIKQAAQSFGVDPVAIGTILFAEKRHRDPLDYWADFQVEMIVESDDPAQRERLIESTNYGLPGKDVTDNVTLGWSQLTVTAVTELAADGYLDEVFARGDTPTREEFDADPVGGSFELLMNDALAPSLVGAWAVDVIDRQSGAESGTFGITYPDFSLDGDPLTHFVFLTGTYADGGTFPSAALNADPASFVDAETKTGPNLDSTNALRFREPVWNALYPDDEYSVEKDELLGD